MMGRKIISYTQYYCDGPNHKADERALPTGVPIVHVDSSYALRILTKDFCIACWNDMTKEQFIELYKPSLNYRVGTLVTGE